MALKGEKKGRRTQSGTNMEGWRENKANKEGGWGQHFQVNKYKKVNGAYELCTSFNNNWILFKKWK